MTRKRIIVPMKLGVKGEFRALVHKGDGVPIIETPYAKNLVTAGGINTAFVTTTTSGYCVAGDGNTTPALSDVTLASYKGKMTTHLGVTGSVNNDPLGGDLYVRSEARVQFIPGAFGISAVNIAEAGFTHAPGALGVVDASTPLFNRGLLVDSFGNPTTVAVQPDEYLDLFWRFTVYLPYDAVGTVSIDVDGVPTNFDYVVRPSNLNPLVGPAAAPWNYMVEETGSTANKNTFFHAGLCADTGVGRSGVLNTGLIPPSTTVSSPGASVRPSEINLLPYTDGNFYRDAEFIWTLSQGNVSGGIQTAIINLGWTQWQVEFSPVLPKTDLKQLELIFRIAIANTP